MIDALLTIENLTIEYRGHRSNVYAVTDVNLEVAPAEIVAVIGETGSGKSSLVRTVLGLLPHNGHVISGTATLTHAESRMDLVRLDAARLRSLRGSIVGFVPQSTRSALNPVITVADHFRATYRAHGINIGARSDWSGRAASTLATLGFADPHRVLASYAHQLSGGMAQRVVLSLATALNPALLIADEPTSGLDASVKVQVLAQLAQQAKSDNRGVLLVTHDIGSVASTCDKVAVMYGGVVVESGNTSEVLSNPIHPYTRALLDAIPQRGKPIRSLPGNATPNNAPLSTCAFASRCPIKNQRCVTKRPPLAAVDVNSTSGHKVATLCESPSPKGPHERSAT